MKNPDQRIDAYISKALPFAQPILKHLRALVHKACPDVKETIKWGMPSFDYKGPYFSVAAFKQHCAGGFWKYKLINDPKGYLGERKNTGGEAMGNLGRMTSLKDLPPDKAMIDFLKQAKKLNDDGVKVIIRKITKEKKEIVVPDYFLKAISKNKNAKKYFEAFTPGKKKEYVEWLVDAKTDETRNNRLAQAVKWISENKIRNWKYLK